MTGRFLPGVPGPQIERIFNAAPGNEIATGKLDSPESSAALAANTFGYFLNRPGDLPSLPGCEQATWPAGSLALEKTVRFPWRGGRHPVLDVLVVTSSALIGIESKRFEPFRRKSDDRLSDAYWRPAWGDRMKGYESVRDSLREDKSLYSCLDAAQLVKHAFALRTQVHRAAEHKGLIPVLLYLYAEPTHWPRDGALVDEPAKIKHRDETVRFARAVTGDEVMFTACTYRELLAVWKRSGTSEVCAHAEALTLRHPELLCGTAVVSAA